MESWCHVERVLVVYRQSQDAGRDGEDKLKRAGRKKKGF